MGFPEGPGKVPWDPRGIPIGSQGACWDGGAKDPRGIPSIPGSGDPRGVPGDPRGTPASRDPRETPANDGLYRKISKKHK